MKKIEPVRRYVVFVTKKDTEHKPPMEVNKELENIIRKQIINCAWKEKIYTNRKLKGINVSISTVFLKENNIQVNKKGLVYCGWFRSKLWTNRNTKRHIARILQKIRPNENSADIVRKIFEMAYPQQYACTDSGLS